MSIFQGVETAISQTSMIGTYILLGTILTIITGALAISGYKGLKNLKNR